jgi:hypothetical protein
MNAIEQISGLAEPRPRVITPSREEPPDRHTDPMEKPRIPDPIRAPEPIQRRFQARLNYDPIEADVFLEILDPETGEVLRRFPAEKAEEDETTNRGGAIFNRLA